MTPHAVSGRGQCRLLWTRTLTRRSSLLLGLVAGGQFRVLLQRGGVLRCPSASIRRSWGWRANPPLKGGSGAVLPAKRAQRSRGLRGRGTSLLRPCGVAPLRGASGPAAA